MVVIRVITLCLLTSSLFASEIHLIYPRLEAGQDTFRYERSLDSTFILGHITEYRPTMSLTCEGVVIPLTSDGAFLAYLPIPWYSETFGWNLTLTNGGVETSKLFFAFSPTSANVEPAWHVLPEPASFVVKQRNTHTRTAVGGSYHLFPDSGTVLKVIATSDLWLKFVLADEWTGVIERRFTDSLFTKLHLPERIRLGNGEIAVKAESVKIAFDVQRQPLFETAVEADGNEINLTLFGTTASLDRIRYIGQARDFVQDVTWSQRAHGVDIAILLAEPTLHGFSLETTDSSLTLNIFNRKYATKTLRGKRIALDPGHGGVADGAIGPLGNKEKDVVLRWSEILEKELTSYGAIVLRTRTDDTAIGLHDRVKLARNFNADVFLSLHGNALSDGENPFERRGCGTYYYQSLSRGLAETIQNAVLAKTGLHDDGISDANFAVVRPTDFPAVLIEAAFMMHPDEELKLTDEKFLLDLSRGVANGLLDFFSTAPAR